MVGFEACKALADNASVSRVEGVSWCPKVLKFPYLRQPYHPKVKSVSPLLVLLYLLIPRDLAAGGGRYFRYFT